MPLASAEYFGRGRDGAAEVAAETLQVAEESTLDEAAAEVPQADASVVAVAEVAPATAAAEALAGPVPDIAPEPEPTLDDLARTLVEAAAEAAKTRSRRHTVVYSARPLDDAEMEAVAAYVHSKLDVPGADDLDAATTTDVRIVVDGQVVEGTLDINDEPDLVNVVDESLIMGIRIVRGDTVIDGSLRHRLDELKHTMHS